MASSASENRLLLSKIATNEKHGEDSPYFDGWKAYDQKPFHPTENPEVLSRWIWQKISFPSTWLKSGLRKIPKPLFALLKELRSSETWPIFKTTMAYQSSNRFYRDLRWRTGVQIVPVDCDSSNNFKITKGALEAAYEKAQYNRVTVEACSSSGSEYLSDFKASVRIPHPLNHLMPEKN
ncbi:1-aminocyclopropane-1-carboxylate synthase 1 [Pyrus x bretschneideri]|uniref:1-aminocyclopropane-1-carboxylate synthase 1 n=1 Tax=Pyrus x bretschneideri TaxID=225117 RepID=UPI0020309D16|nr:1-aminocyclopropane-1-carboxylate synthase 1 [Pyrus x bretschneideri]